MGLDSVKTRIISYEGLCQDFDGCVTLYKDFVKQSSTYYRQSLGIFALSLKIPVEIKVFCFPLRNNITTPMSVMR